MIEWGHKYDSPPQQVRSLFADIAATYGNPEHELYSVRPSSDFPELPQPSTDMEVLQTNFLRWGYCLVQDALSADEIAAATERLLDQAEAERMAKVATLTPAGANTRTDVRLFGSSGNRQLVSNLASKGEIWRTIATYESHNGHIVGDLMHSILGDGLLLSSMHGVVVEQGSGAQGVHQGQGFPLPHPPFPTHANIICAHQPRVFCLRALADRVCRLAQICTRLGLSRTAGRT